MNQEQGVSVRYTRAMINTNAVSIFVLIVVSILGGYYLWSREEGNSVDFVPQMEADALSSQNGEKGSPTFVWQYRAHEGEIPRTTISLTARYENGEELTKEIDTIEGECNAYDSESENVYTNSSMIICYYAGLGRYYKVVADGSAYAVQRKVFEEASPEYDPPVEVFETIGAF